MTKRQVNVNSDLPQTPPSKEYPPVTTTSDEWVLENVFGGGCYCVMYGTLYRYKSGYWEAVDDSDLEVMIVNALRDARKVSTGKDGEKVSFPYLTSKNVTSAHKLVKQALSVNPPENTNLRCFRNGTLDVTTKELLPHAPEHYLTSVVDADYIQDAPCPDVFNQYLLTSFGEDQLELIRAVLSMYIDPTAPFGKFLHVLGESGSGKGILIRLVCEFFDGHYQPLASMIDLQRPEQVHQFLMGKSILAFPDVCGHMEKLGNFYELVDNGIISGRPLYSSQSYARRWNIRVIVASVMHLQIKDSSGGWDRRCIPIRTLGAPKQRDCELEAKLQAPEVRSAIVSWCLGIDRDRRGEILRHPEQLGIVSELQHETRDAGSSVYSFIDKCLRPDKTAPRITSQEIYGYYKLYCESFGYIPKNLNNFVADMKRDLERHYEPQRRPRKGEAAGKVSAGRLPAGWVDVTFSEGAFTEDNFGKTKINPRSIADGGIELFEQFHLDRVEQLDLI